MLILNKKQKYRNICECVIISRQFPHLFVTLNLTLKGKMESIILNGQQTYNYS